MRSFEWFKEGMTFSWQLLKDNLGLLVKVILIVLLVSGGLQVLVQQLGRQVEENPTIQTSLVFSIVTLFTSLVAIAMDAGKDKIILKLVDKKRTSLNDLLISGRMVINIFIASLLYGLMVMIGSVFFIIPGIYLAIKYSQFVMVIIDKNVGPFAALNESSRLTKDRILTLFGFGMLSFFFNVLGFFMFFIGLVVTSAVTGIAGVWVYRKLEKSRGK